MQGLDLPLRLPQLRGQTGGFARRGRRVRHAGGRRLGGSVSGDPLAQGALQPQAVLEQGLVLAQAAVKQLAYNLVLLGGRKQFAAHLGIYGRAVLFQPRLQRGVVDAQLTKHLALRQARFD